jgi:predicted nucleic acid-binding protein
VSVAYVDTSCLVAIAFGEPGAETVAERLEGYDHRVSSNLLEAELRSALAREEVDESPDPLLASLGWLLPDRPLGAEYATALAAGYLRGADLWHVACALYLRSFVPGLAFVTLDGRQRSVADTLGFPG